jgi:hypothetical protein
MSGRLILRVVGNRYADPDRAGSRPGGPARDRRVRLATWMHLPAGADDLVNLQLLLLVAIPKLAYVMSRQHRDERNCMLSSRSYQWMFANAAV